MPCTPKKTIDVIVETGNHYVAQVKGNQKTLFREIQRVMAQQIPLDTCCQTEKGHGRMTTWQVFIYDASKNCKAAEWKNLQRFVHVHRQRIEKGKHTVQDAFFISDLLLSAQDFHQGIRGHWGIENRLHWVKDVIHKEDGNKIRKGNAPVNLAVLSTIAINIHRKNGNTSITDGQIKFGANVKELFKLIRT